MSKTIDITVTGFGVTKTFFGIENSFHSEFYVNAIDAFNAYTKEIGANRPKGYWDFVDGLTFSHTIRDNLNLKTCAIIEECV